MDRDSGSGWYAFLIEQKDNVAKQWSVWTPGAGEDDVARGSGIREDVQGTAKDFAREMIDLFLDRLVADPVVVEYLLYEDDYDTMFRVRVWDIPVVDGDRINAGWGVPAPGTPLGGGYARGLSVEGLDATSVVTLPAHIVRSRLHRKLEERREQHSRPPVRTD